MFSLKGGKGYRDKIIKVVNANLRKLFGKSRASTSVNCTGVPHVPESFETAQTMSRSCCMALSNVLL